MQEAEERIRKAAADSRAVGRPVSALENNRVKRAAKELSAALAPYGADIELVLKLPAGSNE